MISTLTATWPESDRVQALRDLKVLDTPSEERFDRLTRLARRIFDVPIALSHDGVEATETPRVWSFCSHAIREPRVMIVRDSGPQALVRAATCEFQHARSEVCPRPFQPHDR